MIKLPTFEQCVNEFNLGNVYQRFSKCGNYCIFNYSETVEFKKNWNDVNVWCRGIIFDVNTHDIVALPYKKFWNLNQNPECTEQVLSTKGNPTVYSKEDGSLGILFYDKYQDKLIVATRGSFESDQAIWATEWANNQHTIGLLPKYHGLTHLFEIVYPDNRIVTDYNGFEGLIYLSTTAYENGFFTGFLDYSLLLEARSFRCARKFNLTLANAKETLSKLSYNEEGYVFVYPDSTMVKLKGDEYLKVHRIRFDLTDKRICERLIETDFNLDLIIAGLPDEFHNDIKAVHDKFKKAFECDWEHVQVLFRKLTEMNYQTRKEQAFWIRDNVWQRWSSVMFMLLNNETDRARKMTMTVAFEEMF